MTRADLIARLASSAAISVRDAELVLSTVLDAIGTGLEHGDRIELRGFGIFEPRQHPARQARNPRTGEAVTTAAKASVHFKAGTAMHRLLNGDPAARVEFQAKREAERRRRDDKGGQLTLL
ncbi:MAG: HU family DNA-binding protein [Geminicoccaceae bacterium]